MCKIKWKETEDKTTFELYAESILREGSEKCYAKLRDNDSGSEEECGTKFLYQVGIYPYLGEEKPLSAKTISEAKAIVEKEVTGSIEKFIIKMKEQIEIREKIIKNGEELLKIFKNQSS